jgi:integrase
VKEITPAHVLDVLRRAEKKTGDTRPRKRGDKTRTVGGGTVVTRLRQVISGTFDHAIATLRVESNPAAPVGRSFKAHKTIHKTPLKDNQIGTLLRAFDDYGGHFQTVAALVLLWLTLSRPSELAGAQWKEVNLDTATWVIPPERMKMNEEHTIPLPTQAVTLLRRLQALNGERDHVFPHRDRRSEPMTYDALNKGISRLGLPFHFTPHAGRTTASTILNTMGYRGEVIESQLAHQERNAVRRAYNRATYVDERRLMMQAWADYLDKLKAGAEVIPLHGSAA